MAFRRIEDSELVGKGNVGQPDTPGVSTSEMQRIMDEIPREIIVPAFNNLSDQLSDASSAASLGASVPSGVSASKNVQSVIQGVLNLLNSHKSDTNNPHTTTASQVGAYSKGEADQKVQNAVSAHSDRTDNPHAVTAAQTGAYTRAETDAAIGQRVVEIGAGDMAKSVYDPQDGRIDVTVQTYAHTKSGTVHNFAGSGANGRAKMTADVAAGDTFTVNGAPVTAYMGAESAADAMAGGSWSGRWVSFVFDGATLDFKGGGGRVTVSGLSADAVKTGVTVTVKQGAKTVQTVTGTFTNDGNIYNSAVLENLVGYSKGQRIVGTMPNKSSTIIRIPLNGPDANVGGYTVWGNGIAVVPAVGYYGGYSHLARRLEISGPELASAVGLTPAVLKAGTTVLGVVGTLLPANVGYYTHLVSAAWTPSVSYTFQSNVDTAIVVAASSASDSGSPAIPPSLTVSGATVVGLGSTNTNHFYTTTFVIAYLVTGIKAGAVLTATATGGSGGRALAVQVIRIN